MRLKQSRKSNGTQLFMRADQQWDRGNLQSAFLLFLAAAKAGDRGALLSLGYFYDTGVYVRQNRSMAFYWYKRAYRRGDASAANNIGTIWRDDKHSRRALYWFHRAVAMGNESSNLEIAKHYLQIEGESSMARGYLEKVCASNCVSEDTLQQAKRLLRGLSRKSGAR